MKNIHVLPTDQPSRLYKLKATNEFFLHPSPIQKDFYMKSAVGQNIYITSDEEITGFENNIWVYNNGRVWLWQNTMALRSDNKPKKIILTTDQDLIKDGVQSIEDEFLEWFVKNPSCEEVEVTFNHRGINGVEALKTFGDYKIIIPKTTQQIIDEDFAGGLEIVQFIPKQEKIYTEEDVKNAFLDGWQLRNGDLPFPKAKKSWFNKFKNK